MRNLFTIDLKNYNINGTKFERPSAKAIIIKERKLAMIHRIQKGEVEDIFIQDNFYYFCDVADEVQKQNLDDYEADEKFTLEFVDAKKIIETNDACSNPKADKIILQRESWITKMLAEEGFLR